MHQARNVNRRPHNRLHSLPFKNHLLPDEKPVKPRPESKSYMKSTEPGNRYTPTKIKYPPLRPYKRRKKSCRINEVDKCPLVVHTKEGNIEITLGDTQYSALIDTGAHISVISKNVVTKNPYLNQLKRYSPTVYEASTALLTNPISFEFSIFPRVKIGEFAFHTQIHVTSAIKPDVIIGVPFFRETMATIDYTGSEMMITLNNGIYTPKRVTVPPHGSITMVCKPYSTKIEKGPTMVCRHSHEKIHYCYWP